jgi:hypothetical protein
VRCPGCDGNAPFHSHRPKTFVTLLGTATVSRAYYRCRCGRTLFPFDRACSLTGRCLSLAAERAAALAGAAGESFAQAADVTLLELAGLRVGESTVERVTEEAGGILGDELESGRTYGAAEPFRWNTDARGRTVGYVGIDAVGVPQQGPGGARAEGRMPYVAMIYNPPQQQTEGQAAAAGRLTVAGEPVRMQARYLAGLYALPLLGLLLRRQAAQVGMGQAQLWVGLSDAGGGLEGFVQANFNRADLVIILDFYHPASRLEELAKLWHEGEPDKGRETAAAWCKVMKHQGGAALLELLRSQPPPGRAAALEKYREMLTYLENQKHRMDYPYYIEQGWYIGSGPVESACKTVVSQRLKLAGMRWGEAGTDHLCHLRALLRSGSEQWDAFWQRRINQGSPLYQQT